MLGGREKVAGWSKEKNFTQDAKVQRELQIPLRFFAPLREKLLVTHMMMLSRLRIGTAPVPLSMKLSLVSFSSGSNWRSLPKSSFVLFSISRTGTWKGSY